MTLKNKLTLTLLISLILTSAASCKKDVESMEPEDYIAANASVSETEEVTTEPPTAEPTEEPTTEPLLLPENYEISDSHTLEVENILQKPELPTGCEVTALAIALNFHGFDIDKVELCDGFMPIDPNGEYTFDEKYIGNPKLDNGFGCNAPVIVETAEKYFESVDSDWKPLNLTGTEFTDLFYQLEKGRPVVIWASMGLKDVTFELRWTTADGDEAWFATLEHCMVLTGFDTEKGVVYAADPLKGNMEYSLERFQSVYDQMGKQAIVLYEEASE